MKKTALITGASAGIGKAFADEFGRNGFNLVVTARREDRLKELQASLTEKHGVEVLPLPADLHNPQAPQDLFDKIESEGIKIDALVNNAGYGIPGFYHDTNWKTQADFIQAMLTAVAHLSHLFLPGMIERKYGRIINVSSLSGLLPASPGYSLYGAVKSFLNNFSQTLFLELQGTGVNVMALCPGFTYSEFHDAIGMREEVSKMPSYMWMDAETVARQGFEASMKGESIYINGKNNRFFSLLSKLLPNKRTLKMIAKTTKQMHE